jgi:rubredoxin
MQKGEGQMRKFKCSICGYIYDEAAGLAGKGIPPGTKWEDVPGDFVCILCGAPKSAFEELKDKASAAAPVTSAAAPVTSAVEHSEALRELSAGELAALCINLGKGCEKQQLGEEKDLFYQLAEYYESKHSSQNGKGIDDITALLDADFSEGFAQANSAASANADRGALRALVWSEKVSRMLKSLLDRYAKEGDAMLENTKIYVCDICGFVYVGDNLPEVCPVCKVPNFKISQIGRR